MVAAHLQEQQSQRHPDQETGTSGVTTRLPQVASVLYLVLAAAATNRDQRLHDSTAAATRDAKATTRCWHASVYDTGCCVPRVVAAVERATARALSKSLLQAAWIMHEQVGAAHMNLEATGKCSCWHRHACKPPLPVAHESCQCAAVL